MPRALEHGVERIVDEVERHRRLTQLVGRDDDGTQPLRERPPARVRLAGDDVGDTAGAGGGDRQRADGPAPGHEDALSGADAAAGQTVERDRERLGQRSGAHRHARRYA